MSNIDNTYEKLQALRDDINHAKVKEPTILESCLSAAKFAALLGAGMAIVVCLKDHTTPVDVIEVVKDEIDVITS